jgi:hypothetical protein
MTDTPRTDAEGTELVSIEFARQLERELSALKTKLAESEAGSSGMRDCLEGISALPSDFTSPEIYYRAVTKITKAALSTTAGTALLAELKELRELKSATTGFLAEWSINTQYRDKERMGMMDRIGVQEKDLAAARERIARLEGALEPLLQSNDEETGSIDTSPNPTCPQCTLGTVPHSLNKGLCVFHAAQQALTKEGEV